MNLPELTRKQKYIIEYDLTNKKEHKKRTMFHYAPIDKLNKILDASEIKPSNKFLDTPLSPVLWLSNNPNHEFAESTSMEGMGRIEIHGISDIIPWEKFKVLKDVSKETASKIEFIGSSRGSKPSLWYTRTAPITFKNWEAVEIYSNGHWVLYDKARAFNKKHFKYTSLNARVYREAANG